MARGGPAHQDRHRADLMSVRYSGQRVLSSAGVKARILRVVLLHPLAQARPDNALEQHSFMWHHVVAGSGDAPRPAGKGESSSSSSSSDSSSSSADESEGSEQIVWPDVQALSAASWFVQGSKMHIVREVSGDEGRPIPWCRTRAFCQVPARQGSDLSSKGLDALCLRCVAAVPPADSLRARIWREMRRRTLTIIEMRKVKSVVGGTSPLDEDKISLEKGVTIQFNKVENQAPRSVIEYYLKLRILCYAWCWSGNFKAKCVDNKEYIMMSLSAAIDYADFVLRHTLLYGNNNLGWMSRLDLMTRGTMAGKVRRGMTAEHALAEALREHIDWRSQVHANPGPSCASACKSCGC